MSEVPKPKKRMIYSFKGTVAELGKDLQWYEEFMEFVGEQELNLLFEEIEQELNLLMEEIKILKGVDINGF